MLDEVIDMYYEASTIEDQGVGWDTWETAVIALKDR